MTHNCNPKDAENFSDLYSYLKETYQGVFDERMINTHIEEYIGFNFANRVMSSVLLEMPDNAYLLDIGSGFGSFVIAARRSNIHAFGIELSSFETRYAYDRTSAESPLTSSDDYFSLANGLHLPFPEHTFDVVTCWNVLEHISNLHQLISEIYRVLKTNGQIFIICPNYAAFRNEAHYNLLWPPLLPRFLANFYLKFLGKNPKYFKSSIFYRTNLEILRTLKDFKMKPAPLFGSIHNSPKLNIAMDSAFQSKLENPEIIETPWKRFFVLTLKRLHLRWIVHLFNKILAYFKFWLAWCPRTNDWLRFYNPWVNSVLIKAQKPPSKLLVIIPDALSAIVAKGEFQPRYYNPGNLFEEVHILMTTHDEVTVKDVQHTVGTADIHIHSVEDPGHLIYQSPFFRPWLLNTWALPIFNLARLLQRIKFMFWARKISSMVKNIQPDLIRCHSNDYNSYLASYLKRKYHIPYAISLHTNPDTTATRRSLDPNAKWEDKLFARLFEDIEILGLRDANIILPVYKPIIPYLNRLGFTKYQIIYNVLSDSLQKKKSYGLSNPVRLISVGRHFNLKNPDNVIRAVAEIPNVHLTLVGNGPLQDYLENLVGELRIHERIQFLHSVRNADLCKMLPDFDIFVIHSDAWEIGKAVLEALLTGMPIIANYRIGEQTPEMMGDFVHIIHNTKEDYINAIQKLIQDHHYREELGRKAYEFSQKNWAPEKTEAEYVKVYLSLVNQKFKRI